MAGNGRGAAGDNLSWKRKRDGDRNTIFPSDFLFSSRDVEGSINGVFHKDYHGPDPQARAQPAKTPSIPRNPKNEEINEEDREKFLEEHYEPFRSKYGGVSVGTWARVKRGKYMGDLAQVVNVNEFQRKATVKLLPRIDLQAMAQKYSGDTGYQYTSPAPRLITSTELNAHRLRVRHSLDPDTGDLYEVFDGMKLKDGYVFKKLALDSLNFNCNPSEAELIKFNPSNTHESNYVNNKQTMHNNNQVREGLSSSYMNNRFEVPDPVIRGRNGFGNVQEMAEPTPQLGFEGLSEANFVEKLKSGAQELTGLMEEAATRCLCRVSVEDQLRCALVELQSSKERVSAVGAERDNFRDRLEQERKKGCVALQSCKEMVSAAEEERDNFRNRVKHEQKKVFSIFRKILKTDFNSFTRLKEDVGVMCARHEANV